MLRKAKHHLARPYTGRVTLVLEIQQGVCLRHSQIVADGYSAILINKQWFANK